MHEPHDEPASQRMTAMNLRRPTATQAASRPSRRHHDRLPRGASYALGALPRLLVAAAALLKRDHGEI